jgi:hypothetical protein
VLAGTKIQSNLLCISHTNNHAAMSGPGITMTPKQLVAAVRSKDPMDGLCAARQITGEGCDWLKFALDPFHDLQLDNLKGYPDVSTEPTVIVKVRQAVEVSAPVGLPAGSNWDCHIALSPIDWAKTNGVLTAPLTAATGFNAMAQVYPQGGGLVQAGLVGPPGTPAGQIRYLGDPVGGTRGEGVCGRVDGLVINSVPAGAGQDGDMTFTPGHMPMVAADGYALENINLDRYLDFESTDLGVYRLVYSGFEVVNTTAQIYKQGACTVYEYGHSLETSQATVPFANRFDVPPGTSAALPESFATNTFRSPPNTIAEAKIMPGAHTWAAQDGCYCTSKFQGDNPFQAVTNRNYIVQQNQTDAGRESGYGKDNSTTPGYSSGSIASPGFVGSFQEPHLIGPPNTNYGGTLEIGPGCTATPAVHFSHMSTSGAYFTGLSPQTTLFVTWRVGLERLPAANKPTFLALAQPSATYDPNALVLYNLIANHLPPGCPQGWNDLGKWFNTIANIAKKVIPAAFPLVGTAQMILNSLGAPASAAALPEVIRGGQQAVKFVKLPNNQKGQQAVKLIQTMTRARQSANAARKGSPSVQNFGQPGGGGRRGVQQFSQMS